MKILNSKRFLTPGTMAAHNCMLYLSKIRNQCDIEALVWTAMMLMRALTVIIPVIIISVIIISFSIAFLRNKWKIKRKTIREVKRVRTNEESPSNIPRDIQMRDPYRGEHSETKAQRSGELSFAISFDLHIYTAVYRLEIKSFNGVRRLKVKSHYFKFITDLDQRVKRIQSPFNI